MHRMLSPAACPLSATTLEPSPVEPLLRRLHGGQVVMATRAELEAALGRWRAGPVIEEFGGYATLLCRLPDAAVLFLTESGGLLVARRTPATGCTACGSDGRWRAELLPALAWDALEQRYPGVGPTFAALPRYWAVHSYPELPWDAYRIVDLKTGERVDAVTGQAQALERAAAWSRADRPLHATSPAEQRPKRTPVLAKAA